MDDIGETWMSLQEQNRMLQILHRKKISRKNIKVIMNDLKIEGIFNESEEADDDKDWELIDQKAEIWFNNKLTPVEKLKAIYTINVDGREQAETLRSQNLFIIEQRIQKKIKEMEDLGLIKFRKKKNKGEEFLSFSRYGRTPLHEAIAMRDLDSVRKYIKKGLYLTYLDNNGHTPMEMAHYEGYKEAIMIFKAHQKKKKKKKK